MATLNELAVKLQSYIINTQMDGRNRRSLNKGRYNNLKLKVNTGLEYPNIVVTIGISEATYNVDAGTKTDGSLGPDEVYVYKWITNPYIAPALKEIYLQATELVNLEEEQEEIKEELEDELKQAAEGQAGESDIDTRPSRRSKKNFRSLMMPVALQHPELEEEKFPTGKKHKNKLGELEEGDEVYENGEVYSENSDLEVYQEQKLESLEEESKKSDFINFIRNSFGKKH